MNFYKTKRLVDIIGAVCGLIASSPIFLLTAIAIKLTSPGPVFADIPMRVGLDGELFKMYKFRSMFVGAHEILHNNPKYKDLLEKYEKNSYKLSIDEDPRITWVGRIIRKTSIDELPQLLNIVNGDMSIVGPRAYYPFELENQQKKYPAAKEFVRIILTAKPGLTGVWQVSGRSNIDFDKRVALDAKYVEKKSILYDFIIMLKTVPVVLSATGSV